MFGLIIFFVIIYTIWYLLSKGGTKNGQAPAEPEPPVTAPKLFALTLALVITGYNIFMYNAVGVHTTQIPALGIGMFNLFWIAGLGLAFRKKRDPLFWLTLFVSGASGLLLIWRANGFVQSVNGGTLFIATILLILLNTYETIYWKGFWLLNQTLKLIPLSLKQVFRVFKRSPNQSTKKQNVITIFKTIAITALVLIFFAALLSQADPIFAQLIEKIQEQAFGRTIASLLLGLLVLVLTTLKNNSSENDQMKFKWLSFNDLFVPMLAIVILFGGFLGVQARYLFGSHADLSAFDLTYSEYVRKGFVELLATAFFGGLIAYISIIKSRIFAKDFNKKELTIVTVVLIAELFLMLASAFKRDLMYVEVYGLTRVRIVGGLFLIWLAGILGTLLVMVVTKLKEVRFFQAALGLSLFVWAALNFTNIDMMIINGSPEHHDYVDYFYINNLSSDGVQGWFESLDYLEKDINLLTAKTELTDIEKSRLAGDKLAIISLQENVAFLVEKYAPEETVLERCETLHCNDYYSDGQIFDTKDKVSKVIEKLPERVEAERKWQMFNYSEYQAYLQVEKKYDLIAQKTPVLLEKIRNFQIDTNTSLYKEENRLLREFKYPFISIRLDYRPKDLTSFHTPRNAGGYFKYEQSEIMDHDDMDLNQLVAQSCTDQNAGYKKIAGMIYESNTAASENKYLFFDDTTKTQYYAIVVDDDRSAKLRKAIDGTALFIEADIQNRFSADEGSCYLYIRDWKEIKLLK